MAQAVAARNYALRKKSERGNQAWHVTDTTSDQVFRGRSASKSYDSVVSAVDASVYGAWKEGWLWFENESLPALAERLGRIYGIRVEVAARLGEYTFSGKIRQDRGVEYILNLLSETSDVICKVENGVMRLS